jgi:acetoacetate decarboxylase
VGPFVESTSVSAVNTRVKEQEEGIMGVRGKLTKSQMGYCIPVDAPAYGPPPGYFKRARFLRFDYETDAESASRIVPEQLCLLDPPSAAVMFVEYPWSTAGYYREAFLGVNVMYGDEKLFYACYLMLTKPGFGGREVCGFPKKMGTVEFVQHEDIMGAYMERPQGFRICSGLMRPEQPLEMPPDMGPSAICNLRVIPNPVMGEPPSLIELIRLEGSHENLEMFYGPGNLHFTGVSDLDPWHKVPVVKMIGATYITADLSFKESRILETL